ncbi:unnamed protein product [Auanema sp. JU1783]|nr:unnamed protein product [Auanema sp. JU1783]
MSSLVSISKKCVAQRAHRERSMPEKRARFGILEKKKDYQLRSKDYNEKRAAIKKLKIQALDKNPDEFHHHMLNSEVKNNLHYDKKTETEEAASKVQKMLSDVKDLDYVKYKLTAEKKHIDELKSQLHFADTTTNELKNNHVVYVDDAEQAKSFDPVDYFQTTDELLARRYNRPKVEDLETKVIVGTFDKATVDEVDRTRRVKYNELYKRINRAKELEVVVAKLQLKKDLADSTREVAPKKVRKGGSKKAAVYKWTYERKR